MSGNVAPAMRFKVHEALNTLSYQSNTRKALYWSTYWESFTDAYTPDQVAAAEELIVAWWEYMQAFPCTEAQIKRVMDAVDRVLELLGEVMALPDFNLTEEEVKEVVAAVRALTRVSCERSARFAQPGDHSSLVARRKGTHELEARKRVEAALYGPTVRRIKEIRIDAKY